MSARTVIEAEIQAELPLSGEYLVGAAILFSDGHVEKGRSHPLIIQKMDAEGRLGRYENEPYEAGFLTSLGRFVDRWEATEIASDNNQTHGQPEGGLTSERTAFR